VARVKDLGDLKDYRPLSILTVFDLVISDFCLFEMEGGFFQNLSPVQGHSLTAALLKFNDDISVELER
jgi:hypothetical protein